MELKRVFVKNLKKFRKQQEFSQIKLAELCGTSPNYIAEIETGRRFPSLKLIEKLGRVLNADPFRFFIDETGENQTELDEWINLVAKLPYEQRLKIIHKISKSSQ